MAAEPLVIDLRTLGELLAAVEGYRKQLSSFSDHALAEIELLKFWIQRAIDDGAAKIALAEVPPK